MTISVLLCQFKNPYIQYEQYKIFYNFENFLAVLFWFWSEEFVLPSKCLQPPLFGLVASSMQKIPFKLSNVFKEKNVGILVL